MKFRNFLVATVLVVLCQGLGMTQKISGETEGGIGTVGSGSFSQYVFVDSVDWNLLLRYVATGHGKQKGEFAFGPRFKLNKTTVKLQFGGTTQGQVMVAGTIGFTISGHSLFYIADSKFSLEHKPNTFYQKVFVGLNHGSTIYLRVEDLQVGKNQAFVQLGLEYRKKGDNGHLFIAPYYDVLNKNGGVHAGVRF